MKKKVMALFVAVSMILSLIACGSSNSGNDSDSASNEETSTPKPTETEAASEESEEENTTASEAKDISVNYTFVTPLLSHIVWLEAKKGVEAAGEDFSGLNAVWSGPQDLSAAEQVTYMEMALAEQVDGIATFGTSEEAFKDVFGKIQDAGIELYTGGGDTPSLHDYLNGGANPSAQEWGYNIGAEVGQALKDKGEDTAHVAEFLYALDSALAKDIMLAYEDGLASVGLEVNVLGQWESKSDASVALDAARSVFLTYPEVNTIMCSGGECAGAIATAMGETGKTMEDVKVVGDGVQDDCLAAIEAGTVYATVCQNYYAYGYIPGMWTYMSKAYNEKVNDFYDVPLTIIHKGETEGYDASFYDGKQWFEQYYPDYDWNEVTGK